MKMLDATKHLIEQIGDAFVIKLHLNDLTQIGIHQFHDQVARNVNNNNNLPVLSIYQNIL